MLKRCLFILLSCYALHLATAQSSIPQVPAKMELADLKLTITSAGQQDIQRDVNMLRASDKYFKVKLDRVALYMPIIERIFKEEVIPDDLKYLVLQESALISDAVSASNAVGFWQFKLASAKEVKMRVDNKVDERKNIVSSTRGAAKYFWKHQKDLDNWALTVTAHMTGAAGIKKYVKSGDKGAKKMTIDKKTHWYLKRFLAHKIAFQDHMDHQHSEGLKILEYTKGGGKDIGRIAKDFDISVEKFKEYNKWLLQTKIPTDRPYTATIPVAQGFKPPKKEMIASQRHESTDETKRAEQFQTKGLLDGVQFKSPFVADEAQIKVNGVPAIVAQKGESFNDLVARSGLSMTKFLKMNDLENERIVLPGDIYFVKKKKSRSSIGFHTVVPGDSFWEISQKYGMRMAKVASNNRMSLIDELKPGRLLWLGRKRPNDVDVEYRELPTPPPAEEKPIASRKGRPVSNPSNPSVAPRTSTTTPPKRQAATAKPKPTPMPTKRPAESQVNEIQVASGDFHTVQPGETLWRISKAYGTDVASIREWNNLEKSDPIKPGQKLVMKKVTEIEVDQVAKSTSTYVVQPGDTMYGIAKSHDMELKELLDLNGKANSNLAIGEKLIVYK